MINISTDVLSKYSSILAKNSIPISCQHYYKKWLKISIVSSELVQSVLLNAYLFAQA